MTKLSVYTPLGQDGYELCHPVKQDDFETINLAIDGTVHGADWKPMRMELVREDEGRPLLQSDAPWLGAQALVFRRSAIEKLAPTFLECGELLPLVCAKADLVVYNPTRVIDALDEAASSLLRFDDGRAMMIQRHVFRADTIGDVEIFKIPNLRVSPTFLSGRFVDRWKASGLRGLEFKKVWETTD